MAKKKLFVTNGDESVHLHSENGTAYELAVGNDGALTVTNEATGAVSGGGGGGLPTGGAPHQQLVTDAEGKALWEDRLAYAYTGMVEVLPETTFEVDANVGVAVITEPLRHILIEGGTYEVNWNGTSYNTTCTIVSAGDAGGNVYILGNLVYDGGPDTGEPFTIGIYDDAMAAEQGCSGTIIPLDGSTAITLSIKGEGELIKTIPQKYVEGPLVITITDLTVGPPFPVDTGIEEIKEAFNSGRSIYFDVGGCRMGLQTASVNEETFEFFRVLGGDGEAVTMQRVSVYRSPATNEPVASSDNYRMLLSSTVD